MNLIFGTRKGLFILERNGDVWDVVRHRFEGIPVQCVHVDAKQRLWVGLDHGHWGPKMAVSEDGGDTFRDITAPSYPDGSEVAEGKPASTKLIWAMSSDDNRLFVGTEPGGLFVSDDDGATWNLDTVLWNDPDRTKWFGGGRDDAAIHSIWLNPNNTNHRWIAVSCAGAFETTDDGATWSPKNRGLKADFLPDDSVDVGHDPHLLTVHPKNNDVLWQQNHCGVFRSEDNGANWTDVSTDEGTAYFGFPIAVDEDDVNTAWIVPAKSDECRMTVDGSLFVSRTTDGGKTWTRLTNGLPQSVAFDLVFRHALAVDHGTLAFGTTTGNAYWSSDRGDSWQTISNHLPPIYVTEFAELS